MCFSDIVRVLSLSGPRLLEYKQRDSKGNEYMEELIKAEYDCPILLVSEEFHRRAKGLRDGTID